MVMASWEDVTAWNRGGSCALFLNLPNDVFLRSKLISRVFFLVSWQFVLDFRNEYIVSVEECYDKVFGIEADHVVTMLRFKTNKRISTPFELDAGTTFVLEMKDYKIVGFHGKAGDFVHQLCVHVSPLSKS
ncbi:Myrosinase-binding protein 1 [Cardamine amara subsp. amara]|uniref:Myrosinase-binding protein 1 n=1 Tax=Cardamine amara subsp. amara TaxID=228776 RepID=A0ABD1BSI5_CARAN